MTTMKNFKTNSILDSFSKYIVIFLPILLIFSRSVADATIVIIALLFLYKSFINKNWVWVKESWFIFALIFWGYLLLINTPLSANPEKTLFYSIAFIRWPIFALALAYWILNTQEQQKKFFNVFAIVFGFIVFDCWWQYFNYTDIFGYPKLFDGMRLTGPFRDNPIPGIWLSRLTFLFLLIATLFNPIKKYSFSFISYFLILFIGAFTVFITGERMAFILTLCALFLVLFALFVEKKSMRMNLIYFLFILTISIIIFGYNNPEITNRTVISTIDQFSKIENMFTLSDHHNVMPDVGALAYTYGLVFQSAVKVWLESPILGVGLHTYREVCSDFGLMGTGPGVCWHPHNISLELLSETGIIGFTLFYAMIISIFVSIFKSFRENGSFFILSILSALLFLCFFPLSTGISIFNNGFAAIIWLIVGWLTIYQKHN
tara:strand:- start:119 stop:1414 length:1296 start_codon:yes stop_codon:yes gene_type:complete